MISADLCELVAAADLYLEHGLPVNAGGQMNQSIGFLDACSFVSQEKKYWEKKLGIF